MAGIVDFKKIDKSGLNDAVSLKSWVDTFRSEDELREVFLNMDRAMKYVHEHGYCVKTFDPREIEILNGSVNQIKFNTLLQMPSDYSIQRRIVKEDIYNSTFIQIGIYTKCLEYLNPDFLKQNFQRFSTFLPQGDIPYYRGIVERGASVYFCEYAMEKKKKDLEMLENEVSSNVDDAGGYGAGKRLVKSNGTSISDDIHINDSINDSIYKQINSKSDAAFINFLVYPTIVLILGVLLAVIAFIIGLV